LIKIDIIQASMTGGKEGENPRYITSAHPSQPEPKQLPAQRGEQFPRSKPQDQEGSDEPTHEDMVAAIRRSIAQRRAERERIGLAFDPVAYVGNELSWQEIKRSKGGLEYLESGPQPYFPKLVIAWDVLSLSFLKDERLKSGRERFLKDFAKYLLSVACKT
jgi:hypothetical protein